MGILHLQASMHVQYPPFPQWTSILADPLSGTPYSLEIFWLLMCAEVITSKNCFRDFTEHRILANSSQLVVPGQNKGIMEVFIHHSEKDIHFFYTVSLYMEDTYTGV